MDPFRFVRRGTPFGEVFREETVNGWQAAARALRSGRRTGNGLPGAGVAPSLEVLVSNDTGGDLDELSVLALGAPTPDPTPSDSHDLSLELLRRPLFGGDAPAAATDAFVVTAEPIKDGEVGLGVLAGIAVADVDVSDTSHGFAAPSAGVTANLVSASSGPAEILWRASGTGVRRAVVLLGFGGGSAPSSWGYTETSAPFSGSTLLTRPGGLDGWVEVPAGDAYFVTGNVAYVPTSAGALGVAGIDHWDAAGSPPGVGAAIFRGLDYSGAGLASSSQNTLAPSVFIDLRAYSGSRRIGLFGAMVSGTGTFQERNISVLRTSAVLIDGT